MQNLSFYFKIFKVKSCNDTDELIFKKYTHANNLFEILLDIHINTGHGGRDRMLSAASEKYANITAEVILIFLELCESCTLKNYAQGKGLVSKPIISKGFNDHVQVDLVDMQAQECEDFKFILVYQDHFTKLVQIRPLKRKTGKNVTRIIFEIFSILGPPKVLQSDNGREFRNRFLEQLCGNMGVIMRHGKPRHSQCNGGVERANQDIENMLSTWKIDNPSLPWTTGLYFVQMFKNKSLCAPIKMSPFEATFGREMEIGFNDSFLPKEVHQNVEKESDLKDVGVNLSDGDILVSIAFKIV